MVDQVKSKKTVPTMLFLFIAVSQLSKTFVE